MNDLEKRLRHLSESARREALGASGEVSDFVSEALERITYGKAPPMQANRLPTKRCDWVAARLRL
jgi:hypothetical protein